MKGQYGMFQVLDSFAIRQRNQFYLIGNVISGEVKENWFVIVPFNSGISMSIRINQVESIEIASEDEAKTLLIVNCDDDDAIDFFLALGITLEYLPSV